MSPRAKCHLVATQTVDLCCRDFSTAGACWLSDFSRLEKDGFRALFKYSLCLEKGEKKKDCLVKTERTVQGVGVQFLFTGNFGTASILVLPVCCSRAAVKVI